jgi:hypothetical protein
MAWGLGHKQTKGSLKITKMACEMDMKKRVLEEMYRMLSRNKERDAYRYHDFVEELEELVLDIVLALAEGGKVSEETIEDEIVNQLKWIRLVNWGWSRKDQSRILVQYGVDDALELMDESGLESESWRLETMVEAIMHRYLDVLDFEKLVDVLDFEKPKREPVCDSDKMLAIKEDAAEKKVIECAVKMVEEKWDGDELEEWSSIQSLWEDAVLLVLTGLRYNEKKDWGQKEVDFEIEWVMERCKEDEEWAKKVVSFSRRDERTFCLGKLPPIEQMAQDVMEQYLYVLNFKKLASTYYWAMRDGGGKKKRPTLAKKE